MCTMAAPACAASMAVRAICSGVIAQCGLLATLVSSPVTAQVMKTSGFKSIPLGVSSDDADRSRGAVGPGVWVLWPVYYNDGNNKVTAAPGAGHSRVNSSAEGAFSAQQMRQRGDQAVHFGRRRVMHERRAHDTIRRVDSQGLQQPVGIEIAVADPDAQVGQLPRDCRR